MTMMLFKRKQTKNTSKKWMLIQGKIKKSEKNHRELKYL